MTDNFEVQEPGHFGNLGRNTAVSPGVATLDFGLHQKVPAGERMEIQFRAEIFNILNRANFGSPRRTAFSNSGGVDGNFGQTLKTATTSRQIQVALRIDF